MFLLFPTLFGGVGVVLLVVSSRHARQTAYLLAHGILAGGRVESKQERTSITINDRHPYDVTFSFSLADGTPRQGKTLVTDIKWAAQLAPGTPVGAIYLPDDPGRCAIFNARWRRFFR